MKEYEDYIEEVRTLRNLDPRAALFDVRVEKKGSRLLLLGVTTVSGAVDNLIDRLAEIHNRRYIRDQIVRLPDASLEDANYGLVRAAVAPVYGDPALPAPQITQALLGERIEPLARAGVWYRVRLEDGYIGWIHSGYLRFGDREWAYAWERATQGEPVVSLGAELVNEHGDVFARLPWGARIIRFGSDQFELPDGRRGALGSGEVVAVDRLADRFPARGDSITRTARRWIGSPYLWGGVTPSGVDCSGLVQAVFWLHGIALPRDSDQQARTGQQIDVADDFSNLNAGDLLFFSETPARVSHVVISLGGSEIVHSALTNGGVQVDDLTGNREIEGRLRGLFTSARRVLPD